MKHVTFTRDMKPQHRAGEMRLVPDDVAVQLEAEGAIVANPPSWPEGASEEAKPSPRTRLGKRGRDLLGQTYLTK